MLDGLLSRYRPFTSILVSSLLFGLMHLNPRQFGPTFIAGCFLGWVYLRCRSVLACILIHITNNITVFLKNFLVTFDADWARQYGILDAQEGGRILPYIAVRGIGLGCVWKLNSCIEAAISEPRIYRGFRPLCGRIRHREGVSKRV
jgi:hypothetical protein